MSGYFDQSARSIENRCVIMLYIALVFMSYFIGFVDMVA